MKTSPNDHPTPMRNSVKSKEKLKVILSGCESVSTLEGASQFGVVLLFPLCLPDSGAFCFAQICVSSRIWFVLLLLCFEQKL